MDAIPTKHCAVLACITALPDSDVAEMANTGMEETTPLFGISLSDFEPISGRPVMSAQYYDAYKAAGAIPKWVRSRHEFNIGFLPYVIVGVLGRGDPNPVPVILEQPQNQRVLVGNTAWFTVGASPHDYLSYQWKFRGRVLTNQNYYLLIVHDVAKAHGGIYTVSVNAGGKPVVSRRTLLTVVTPVSVRTHPLSRSIRDGNNVAFRVGVRGTGPFTYQWFHNDTLIEGATKSFYRVTKGSATNAGSYRVVVGNGLSYAVSNPAILTVSP